jgi:hypothetical protein
MSTVTMSQPKTAAQFVYAENAFQTLKNVDYPLDTHPGIDGLALTFVVAARMSGAKLRATIYNMVDQAWELSDEISE